MTELVRPDVRRMAGAAALPRENGELVFRKRRIQDDVRDQRDETRRELDWDEFRRRLIAAIDADPARPYYESWTSR
jgi:hypothetical protein